MTREEAEHFVRRGSVVQIHPTLCGPLFQGCFLLVTEVKTWGVQGFFAIPKNREEPPGEAYFRAKWEEIEYVGLAPWVPDREEDGDD
jgi:hypothetical protein